MFDLNEAISNWKLSFGQNGKCGTEDVLELEVHLREQVGILVRSGLSEREAFLVGISRLGAPEEISDEYAKADPAQFWRHRCLWMAVGVLCWWSLALLKEVFLAIAAVVALSLGVRNGLELGIASVAVNILFLLLLVLGGRKLYSRDVPRIWNSKLAAFTATRARVALCVVGVLLVGVVAKGVASLPMLYALKVLPDEHVARYGTYAMAADSALIAILTVTIVTFVFWHAGRRPGSLTAAAD